MSGYIQYYGLSENPFDILPDSKYFFLAESHKEALASLLYVVKERKGFMLLVGEDGTGKTVLVNYLMRGLDKNINVVCFPRGDLSFEQMLKELLVKLELPIGKMIKGSMLYQLNEYLIQNLGRGKNLILIIDQAQDISDDVMEELRLTSNLETSTSKLLQIIFVGRPELETKLKSRGLRQLKQRIGTISRLTRISPAESMEYINHRLIHAGGHCDAVFSQEALALICKYADGLPRKINILCHNALFKGFEHSEKPILAATIKMIRNEKNLLTGKQRGDTATGEKQKPLFVLATANTGIKRSLYFCLAILCVIIAVFIGKKYIKNVPEILLPGSFLKPPAVSEKVTVKAPAIRTYSVSKIVQVASSEGNHAAIKLSEAAVSAKQFTAGTKTEIRYKRIIDIGEGANLSSLILDNYNQINTTLMDFILAFNPEIANPDLILIDTKIRMPEITESNLIVKSSDGSIKAHLGTFPTSQEALHYKNFINIKNKEIEIIPRKVTSDKIWFRVMAGSFTSEQDCLKTIQVLRQRGLLPAFAKIPKM